MQFSPKILTVSSMQKERCRFALNWLKGKADENGQHG